MRDISLRDAICKKRDMCLRHVKRNAYHIAFRKAKYIASSAVRYIAFAQQIYRAAKRYIAALRIQKNNPGKHLYITEVERYEKPYDFT